MPHETEAPAAIEPRSLRVRDAMAADREAVIALTLAAYLEYAEAGSESWWELYSRNVAETLRQEVPARCLVAERAGAVLGSVILYPAESRESGWPEVRLLAVHPAARGQGIAGALMDECLRRARASGATSFGLHTMEIMAVARAMYERMGFVRDPARDFHPAPGVEVLGYRLDLAPER